MRSHGDIDTCAQCGHAIEYVEYSRATGTGTVEVLDAWWAHIHHHPADDHDGVATHERAFRLALDVLAAQPRRRRWWRR